MKIMLDNSPQMINQKAEKFGFEFWQLRTPLTRHRVTCRPYGLDNGGFKEFKRKTWERLVVEADEGIHPIFVTLPDIVCDAVRTMDLFDYFSRKLTGLPKCLVLQDGIGNIRIPWEDISAVFVGGSDQFKLSDEAINACKVAKMLGKWVHVGRVNEVTRLRNWTELGDSIDGSGISRFDHMLKDVVDLAKGDHRQGSFL